LLPVADLVMIAMLSRPPAGSLRHTWVTAATVLLSLAVAAGATALAVLVLLRTLHGASALVLVAEAPLAAAALGAADLAAYGIRQRLLRG
jgi:hypothetical protein